LLSNKFPRKSTTAWVVLGLYILIYDIIAMALSDVEQDRKTGRDYETLSDGCWRGVEHPIVRWPIWLSVIVIAKHLAAPKILRKYDPISIVGLVITIIRKRGIDA